MVEFKHRRELWDLDEKLLMRSKEDPQFFCEHCLSIVDKEGHKVPFKLNGSQRAMMAVFKKQWAEKRRVRMVVMKSRQVGISTLCVALMLWRMVCKNSTKALFMTHTQYALRHAIFPKLIAMLKTIPFPIKITQMGAAHIMFDKILDADLPGKVLGSSGAIGSWARGDEQGRGETIYAAHLSEFDYYPDYEKVLQNVMDCMVQNQSIVIIESTSCGQGNLYDIHKKIEQGLLNFEFDFIPWFYQEEYQIESHEPLQLTEVQAAIQRKHHLTDAQMRWYAKQENELGSHFRMQTEFASDKQDSFAYGIKNGLFDPSVLEKASQNPPFPCDTCAIYLGVDPAINHDRIAMVWRQGQNIIKIVAFNTMNLDSNVDKKEYVVNRVVNEFSVMRADRVSVDVTGIGAFYSSMLKQKGIGPIVEVNFANSADDKVKYANKRAELYGRALKWLNKGASIPDNKEFLFDLKMIQFLPEKPNLQLMSKDKMPYSPDIADAFALTFPYDQDIPITSCNFYTTSNPDSF